MPRAWRAEPPCGAFEGWRAQDYLRDYYRQVDEDERHTLDFLVRELRRDGRVARRALAFGVGPTVHHLLALAPWAEAIDAADYLSENLREVRCWLRQAPGAHDWSAFTRHVLACEGTRQVDEDAVRGREALARRAIARLLHGDAGRDPAVRRVPGTAEGYDLVLSCYCAESATADKGTWALYLRNTLRLVRPGGRFLMAALRRCQGYTVGSRVFPCADIDEGDLTRLLDRTGLDDPRQRKVEVQWLEAGPLHGYEGIVLLAGRRGDRDLGPAGACGGSR